MGKGTPCLTSPGDCKQELDGGAALGQPHSDTEGSEVSISILLPAKELVGTAAPTIQRSGSSDGSTQRAGESQGSQDSLQGQVGYSSPSPGTEPPAVGSPSTSLVPPAWHRRRGSLASAAEAVAQESFSSWQQALPKLGSSPC